MGQHHDRVVASVGGIPCEEAGEVRAWQGQCFGNVLGAQRIQHEQFAVYEEVGAESDRLSHTPSPQGSARVTDKTDKTPGRTGRGARPSVPKPPTCSVRGPSEDRREHRKDSSLVMRSSSQNRQARTADGRCQEPGGARVRARGVRSGGWQWVDGIISTGWGRERLSQFLAYLPFTKGTWERVTRLLGADEALYWAKTRANPYEADRDLDFAIDRLIAFGRPHAALWCIQKMRLQDQSFNGALAVTALTAAASSQEAIKTDAHELGVIIKALQRDQAVKPDDLFRVEWMYLPILDHAYGASPVQLERRLATD